MEVDSEKPSNRAPVVRGARACTVCRAAKMKCVATDDPSDPQCQRCKRANVECIFEKHRRGRKPGSKLSEASKMLRRLEKGLNSAKLKQTDDARGPQEPAHRSPVDPYGSPNHTHFPHNELPPIHSYGKKSNYATSSQRSQSMDVDEEEREGRESNLYPAQVIQKETRGNFFHTILNPSTESPQPTRLPSFPPALTHGAPIPPLIVPNDTPNSNSTCNTNTHRLMDPVSAGVLDETQAKVLFDLLFLRLNPFVNLFDPSLHSVHYVRTRCPFLFSVLLMAGCKFFKPELYKQVQKIAHEFATRAFSEGWKTLEVVQAFAALTYWKEPDDTRTWMYIGYACRMAVELSLNRYHATPPSHETEFQLRERRNRERTYLVLFVHDRSLSMQTGRQWMLPEDDLVRHCVNWHEQAGSSLRPEDVIVAAKVQLRRIAAETADMFYSTKGNAPVAAHADVNYDVLLRNCNSKLTQWADFWHREMTRAGGEPFHFSFLSFFRLHVRLFLNSFGIQASMSPSSRVSPSMQALNACCTSAIESLHIVSKEFVETSMLRYGQDSITVMTAYSAVFLLRLLRSSNTYAQMPEGTAAEIHGLIGKTADAYYQSSTTSSAATNAAYHSRFLRSLLANDIFKSRKPESAIDPRLQGSPSATGGHASPQNGYVQAPSFPGDSPRAGSNGSQDGYTHLPPSASDGPSSGVQRVLTYPAPYDTHTIASPQHASNLDAHYWRNMFVELGYGETEVVSSNVPNGSSYHHHNHNHNHHNHPHSPPQASHNIHQQPHQPHQPHQHQHQHQHPHQPVHHGGPPTSHYLAPPSMSQSPTTTRPHHNGQSPHYQGPGYGH